MVHANTSMPGEDPGALIEDKDRLDEIELGTGDEGGEPPSPVKEETPGTRDQERQRT